MHNYVDHRWIKTILNKTIRIIICLTLIYTPFFANASAAEKWEYEPVMKDMNIHVKAYKVDQYGNAVNDFEYNTKIDPKTTANKQKMGTVGFGRLLKSTGWGLLGAAALEALLESVDWIIDPEAQSIWRYKQQESTGGISQKYCKGGTLHDGKGKQVEILYWVGIYATGNCPMTAAENLMNYYSQKHSGTYTFLKWRHDLTESDGYYNMKLWFDYKDPRIGTTQHQLTVVTGGVVQPKPLEKEYLSPEELADYANKTHPDYSNPQLAPKLEPHYSPKISEDLWKPSNNWEETNSPTVQEVQRKLDQSQPEPKKDAEIKPNPETGGSVLPKFCDWAATICDFIKDRDIPETLEDVEIKDIDIGQLNTDTFKATAGCPAPIQVPVNLGTGGNIEISYEPICQFALKWSFVAPLIGFLSGAMILVGVGRKGEDGET